MEERLNEAAQDEPTEATAAANQKNGGLSGISQRQSPPTQSVSELSLTNGHHVDHLQRPLNGSLSSHRESNSDGATAGNRNAHAQNGGIHRSEHDAASNSEPHSSQALEDRSTTAREAPLQWPTDSAGFERANTCPCDIMATLRRIVQFFCNRLTLQAASSHESSVEIAASAAEDIERSSELGDSTFDRTEDEGARPTVQVNVSTDMLDHQLAGQQAQGQGPAEAATNSCAGPVVRTLERLTALHARSLTLVERDEASIRVRIPRDLETSSDGPCSLNCITAIEEPGDAEETHLVEWETFTRALLSIHRCIRHLCLHISAVVRPPGRFYQGFSARDGTAVIEVEVSAFSDPCIDFMLPYLRHLCRSRNPQQATIYVPRSPPHEDDIPTGLYGSVIMGDELPELNDNRFSGMLAATMDMPFLRRIAIYLNNTGTGPRTPRGLRMELTLHGHSGLRRLRFEIDGSLAESLHCESADSLGVSTTLDVGGNIPLPILFASRELTGSTADLAPYMITITRQPSVYNYVIGVYAVMSMRERDDLNSLLDYSWS